MIGILTFFQCYNYGAYLQAYALQQMLLDQGKKNVLINYRTHRSSKLEFDTIVKKKNLNLFEKIELLIKMCKFKILQNKMIKTRRYYQRDDLLSLRFDTVIIGSDQVWCYTKEWGGLDTPFFSDKVRCGNIVAYAVSMGSDNWLSRHPRSIPRFVKNFSQVGARDTNTWMFAKACGIANSSLVLDPTFLYDFSHKIKPAKLKNYLLIYSDDLDLDPKMIQEIRDIGSEKGLTIVSIGRRLKWCDRSFVSLNPFEWVSFMMAADFIVTSMYHGLIFSIKYEREFAMFLNDEKQNKSGDLLKRANLSSRIIGEGNGLTKLFDIAIDYHPVREFIEREKKTSISFLRHAISGSSILRPA